MTEVIPALLLSMQPNVPPGRPFSSDELYRAYALVTDDETALEMATAWEARAQGFTEREGAPLGWGLSIETMALLSLVSPELDERVRRLMDRAPPPFAESFLAVRAGIAKAIAD